MNKLLNDLNKVESISNSGKLSRLFRQPFKYIFAITFKNFIYPITKKGILKKSSTFFDKEMYLMLPSGTDIFLTGGKSHDSEIRLAKFMINHLQDGDCFIDVGTHFGYFSLLASQLVNKNGKVFSYEASKETFAVLKENIKNSSNITAFNKGISDKKGIITFYEFPVLYSEYNTTEINQFEGENWFANFKPSMNEVEAIPLGEEIGNLKLNPKIIKIDVEGSEFKVIKGLELYLQNNNCYIIMEYLNINRHNSEHQKAKVLLDKMGFTCNIITSEGNISPLPDPDQYLTNHNLESENLVFYK